jgi:hypothetical protein
MELKLSYHREIIAMKSFVFWEIERGARYLAGENLEVVWAEFPTLS